MQCQVSALRMVKYKSMDTIDFTLLLFVLYCWSYTHHLLTESIVLIQNNDNCHTKNNNIIT